MAEFCYSEEDLCEESDTWKNDEFSFSQFDKQLRSRWDQAMENGTFRYKLQIEDTKVIGKRQYVAQLNVLRATERRKPDDIDTLQKPFNPEGFNFTKIKEPEVIFEMKKKSKNAQDTENLQNGSEKQVRNVVIINVSPLEYGHVLLVPHLDSCKPQVLTEDAIQWSIETMMLSKHRGFRIGFNSLCAYASVNHQHLHAYYMESELFTESVPVEHIHGCLYALTSIQAKGFAFQLHGSDIGTIARWVCTLTDYFQKNEIAHNLCMTRGPAFNEDRYSTTRTIRIYLWPRKKVTGLKDRGAFNVACVELGGHIPVKNRDRFYELDETEIEEELRQFSCDEEEYNQIRRNITKLVHSLNNI